MLSNGMEYRPMVNVLIEVGLMSLPERWTVHNRPLRESDLLLQVWDDDETHFSMYGRAGGESQGFSVH